MDRTSSCKHLSACVVRPTNRLVVASRNDTEFDLSAFRIADLTRFNEPLGFAGDHGADSYQLPRV
jgi:hypothetical protein